MSWLWIFAFMGSTRRLVSMVTQVIFYRTFDLKADEAVEGRMSRHKFSQYVFD